jgi:hypothetical protein
MKDNSSCTAQDVILHFIQNKHAHVTAWVYCIQAYTFQKGSSFWNSTISLMMIETLLCLCGQKQVGSDSIFFTDNEIYRSSFYGCIQF